MAADSQRRGDFLSDTERKSPRRDSKCWGWGNPRTVPELDEGAKAALRERIGELSPRPRAAELDDFSLPPAEPLPDSLADAVGEQGIYASLEDRVRHATGRGYADLARLRLGGVEVDRRSLTAKLGAGLRGPEAESALNREGLVLGHFPQSFEYATIGGFAATRSAGQASSGYGRFDDLVSSVRLIAPAGEMRTLETPHSAAGPALRELIVGSEGTLGVIPEVTVRVRPSPSVRRYEAWIAEDFESGSEIVRSLAQGPGLPDVIRVSDEEETWVSLTMQGPPGLTGALLGRYLALRRRAGGSLMIVGHEGDAESVARRRALAVRALRAGGAAYLGQSAGHSWEHGRFQGPYLRDTLMEIGAMVETLETAHNWSSLL